MAQINKTKAEMSDYIEELELKLKKAEKELGNARADNELLREELTKHIEPKEFKPNKSGYVLDAPIEANRKSFNEYLADIETFIEGSFKTDYNYCNMRRIINLQVIANNPDRNHKECMRIADEFTEAAVRNKFADKGK